MTGLLWLDSALLSVSLLNTILLLWLGLTVLLHTERRTWGVGVVGCGLLLGAAFFVSHTAMLGHDLHYATRGMEFWWRVGWVPVVALPLAWYVAILWYAGFWSDDCNVVRRRHRVWLVLCMTAACGIVLLLTVGSSLPSYAQVAQLAWPGSLTSGRVSLLFALYPIYVVLCIALSLAALRRPAQSVWAMGARARQRARPWLIATSATLLVVSLLVAGILAWIIANAAERAAFSIYREMSLQIAWLDLIVSSLIAVSVLFLGQAIVSYEIFTGRTLPRRGLAQNWQHIVAVGTGFSLLAGASMATALRPVYSLLVVGLLTTLSSVLLGRRFFGERARTLAQLRPLAVSPHLYDSLGSLPDADVTVDASIRFGSLCENVIGARVAYLVPLGRMLPLCPAPLSYPGGLPCPSVSDLAVQIKASTVLCVALDPASFGGAGWGVPLKSGRDLVGLLLLGDRADRGLYSEEEIEIARASSERLLDLLAVGETAQRLTLLLRQRISESRVLEGQGRRVLHDQVLPQLHTAILYLSSANSERAKRAAEPLSEAHRQISDLIHEVSLSHPQELAECGLGKALCAFVESDLGDEFSDVAWHIAPDAEKAAQDLPVFVLEVLFFAARELIRNAARHGRGDSPNGALVLRVSMEMASDLTQELILSIEDDGVGFSSSEEVMSSTALGGGQGLRLHSAMLTAVGAQMQVVPSDMGGTRSLIVLPLNVWTAASL